MRYYANFKANNGTSLISPIKGRNKLRLEKRIRSLAEAERFSGNTAKWYVWYYEEPSDKPYYVAAGIINDRGCRRYNKDELNYLY